jgi:hypothetical protein
MIVTAVTYLCAFRSSDCHGAALWRVCFAGDAPDRYVCQQCMQECTPVVEA